MEEPAPEPEMEPEPEPKVEEIKSEVDEKVSEEMEEKAPSPAPAESPPHAQEPPKVCDDTTRSLETHYFIDQKLCLTNWVEDFFFFSINFHLTFYAINVFFFFSPSLVSLVTVTEINPAVAKCLQWRRNVIYSKSEFLQATGILVLELILFKNMFIYTFFFNLSAFLGFLFYRKPYLKH